MRRVIVTAEVQDSVRWEEGFRMHGALFRSQTITAMHFAATSDNEFALYAEVDDIDTYLEVLESQATTDAMAYDGVKRETVKVFVLDKQLDLRA